MSVAAELATACFRLMTREPFYGHVISGVQRAESAGLGTMTVSLAPGHALRLEVDPAWWTAQARDPERQVGLIKHQVLHIVLGHVVRERDFLHRSIFWIAADLVVNQFIDARSLTDDDITLRRLAGLKLPAGEDVGTYYDLLLALLGPMAGAGDPSAEGGEGGESDAGGEGGGGPDLSELRRILAEGDPALDQHRGWRGFTEQTAAERLIVEQAIDDAVRRGARRTPPQMQGMLPAAVRRRIAQATETEPAVDWKRLLALFAGASRRTYLQNTLRRPSKRYGTTPGLKVRRRHRVIVVVDTSGSMTDAILAAVFAEVHHLYRRGAEVTIVECDAAVQATWAYRGIRPTAAAGGGGTAFDPALQWANDQPQRPDALIYLTDGYAHPPQVKPRMPTLWLITPGGVRQGSDGWRALPGRRLQLPDDFAA